MKCYSRAVYYLITLVHFLILFAVLSDFNCCAKYETTDFERIEVLSAKLAKIQNFQKSFQIENSIDFKVKDLKYLCFLQKIMKSFIQMAREELMLRIPRFFSKEQIIFLMNALEWDFLKLRNPALNLDLLLDDISDNNLLCDACGDGFLNRLKDIVYMKCGHKVCKNCLYSHFEFGNNIYRNFSPFIYCICKFCNFYITENYLLDNLKVILHPLVKDHLIKISQMQSHADAVKCPYKNCPQLFFVSPVFNTSYYEPIVCRNGHRFCLNCRTVIPHDPLPCSFIPEHTSHFHSLSFAAIDILQEPNYDTILTCEVCGYYFSELIAIKNVFLSIYSESELYWTNICLHCMHRPLSYLIAQKQTACNSTNAILMLLKENENCESHRILLRKFIDFESIIECLKLLLNSVLKSSQIPRNQKTLGSVIFQSLYQMFRSFLNSYSNFIRSHLNAASEETLNVLSKADKLVSKIVNFINLKFKCDFINFILIDRICAYSQNEIELITSDAFAAEESNLEKIAEIILNALYFICPDDANLMDEKKRTIEEKDLQSSSATFIQLQERLSKLQSPEIDEFEMFSGLKITDPSIIQVMLSNLHKFPHDFDTLICETPAQFFESLNIVKLSLVICDFCLKKYNAAVIVNLKCNHCKFCGDCLLQYFVHEIEKDSYSKGMLIKCPVEKCSQCFGPLFVKDWLIKGGKSGYATRYSDNMLINFHKQIKSLMPWAKCKTCGSQLEIEESMQKPKDLEKASVIIEPFHMMKSEISTALRCSCGHTFCFNCGRPPHYMSQCSVLEDVELHRATPCLNCKSFIERTAACSNMTCFFCKTSFCVRCGWLNPGQTHECMNSTYPLIYLVPGNEILMVKYFEKSRLFLDNCIGQVQQCLNVSVQIEEKAANVTDEAVKKMLLIRAEAQKFLASLIRLSFYVPPNSVQSLCSVLLLGREDVDGMIADLRKHLERFDESLQSPNVNESLVHLNSILSCMESQVAKKGKIKVLFRPYITDETLKNS